MHQVERMAYIGQKPWHGLGSNLRPHQAIEVWQHEAGMDWKIEETEVLYSVSKGEGINLKANPSCKVLYRSDTHAALSVVSGRYQIVQPNEILEFYRDLVCAGGFELETAGVLKGGRKIWALAKTGQETILTGGDKVKGYLLLATSCDGSLATTAQFTSIRVVCSNTLHMAVGDTSGAIKVPHSTKFDPQLVKHQLGLGSSSWNQFIDEIKVLADRKVNRFETLNYLLAVLGDSELPLDKQPNQKALQNVLALFNGGGKGSDMTSSKDTAWGLVNSVTEYVDHSRRAMSQDHRLDSAWFGIGASIKEKAFNEAIKLAA